MHYDKKIYYRKIVASVGIKGMMDKKTGIIRSILYLMGVVVLFSEKEITADLPVAYPMSLTGEVTWTLLRSPDNFFGGSVYFPILPLNGLSAYSGVIVRAGSKPVIVKTTETSYIQYRERRFVWDIGIDESISFQCHFGFFVRGGFGYTHAWYRGSSTEAETGVIPTFQAGILVIPGTPDAEFVSRFRIGYSYENTCSSGPHGFSISFQIGFAQ